MKLVLLPVFYVALLNLAVLFIGYQFLKKKMIWQSWLMLVISILIVHLIFLHEHAIIRMFGTIITTFMCMKVIAVAESYKNKKLSLSLKRWLVFAMGWAGMRAEPFETPGGEPLPDAWSMIRFGISRIIAGLLLILLAQKMVLLPIDPDLLSVIISVILLAAFSLVLHFGLLSISAGIWRLFGVNTYFLFKAPVKSGSLTTFWSKRWNIAFSEMTSIVILRPLKGRIGSVAALMAAFAFSGLLHELALSVPVSSGYGLPTLYFIIQGGLVLVEKRLINSKILILKNKIIGKVWVFFWLIVPIPLLFNNEFMKEIVWPLAGINL